MPGILGEDDDILKSYVFLRWKSKATHFANRGFPVRTGETTTFKNCLYFEAENLIFGGRPKVLRMRASPSTQGEAFPKMYLFLVDFLKTKYCF